MLLIGRKTGEFITLVGPDGRTITVLVKEKADGQVTLGVEAPDDVKIWRGTPPAVECSQDASH